MGQELGGLGTSTGSAIDGVQVDSLGSLDLSFLLPELVTQRSQ